MTVLNESQQERLKEITTNLRHIRQENSISLEQIAMQTHIRLACLQALEEWRFEDLPEPVFVQGFIRLYADNLGLDGTAIANTFELDIYPQLTQHLNQKSSFYIPLVIPYILLLIAASTGLFYLIKSEFRDQSVDKQENQIVSVHKKNISSSSSASKPISDVAVTLEFKGNSWLQVTADGKTQFEGTLTKGKRKTWTAKKSLTVRCGNAGMVWVSVNKEKPQILGNEGEVKEVTYTNQ